MRLHELLTAAIKHFAAHGYLHPHEVERWSNLIEDAAEDPIALSLEKHRLRQRLEGAFRRAFGRGALLRRHKKIQPWAAERLMPEARAELERRIYAATDLIRLNRKEAVAKTLQRFKGWVTAVPPGGLPDPEIRPIRRDLSKAALETRFIARRVAVDQTDKMLANVNDIIATGAGAIAGTWDATWEIERKHRPEHAARHGLTYAIRNSWADREGLMSHPLGYTDEHDMPAWLINCRCDYIYLYELADLPPEMLTAKGREALARARAA
jgi:hypothetical protein